LVIGRVVIASLLAAAMVLGQYWPRQRKPGQMLVAEIIVIMGVKTSVDQQFPSLLSRKS
jgi:hypothetical protein